MAENSNNNSLFDQDRLIWRIMNRATDVLILSVIFTLSCIPVVTIGASATALYYVFLKMLRNEEVPALKGYIKAFKLNFKQATIIWLVLLAFGAGIFGSAYYYYMQETTIATGIYALFFGFAIIWLMAVMYVFPLVSRFSNKTKTFLIMSVFMPFGNIGWTLMLIILVLVFVFLGWYVIPFAFVAYGVYAYVSAYIFKKIFKPMEDAIAAKLEKEKQKEEMTDVEEETDEA